MHVSYVILIRQPKILIFIDKESHIKYIQITQQINYNKQQNTLFFSKSNTENIHATKKYTIIIFLYNF